MQIINDNGELKVKLTKREANQCIAALEAHLAWFQAVAVPFYAKVFAPSNKGLHPTAAGVESASQNSESGGG